MHELPRPEACELPAESVIAVPASGMVVYRLVRGPSITEADFVPLSPAAHACARCPSFCASASATT